MGYSLPNYISASHNTHPNYAGYLDSKKTLTFEDMDEIFDMMDEEDKHEGQAFMGSTITIGLIFANFIGGNILHMYDINLLLIVLLIIPILGTMFSFATLLLDR